MENLQTDMVWFMGVVEDINDPFKINRIKVRCFNIHPADTSLVPTSALPWAITTVGRGMNLIEQGDWAVGFFLDGKECQQPFVFGTFSGIPVAYPDKSKGFCDPSGIFPQYINEATTSRLARNENILARDILINMGFDPKDFANYYLSTPIPVRAPEPKVDAEDA